MNGSDPQAIPDPDERNLGATNADKPHLNPRAVWRNALTVVGGRSARYPDEKARSATVADWALKRPYNRR